ncbi:MAG: glycosyltransferase family 2 protein, partial [Alphaproteobacteria bacterium]|nr:glycosyltransferase family 2 protein [Alphaproteobacteria bacterium]
MPEKPLVTVIIPVYNVERYLRRCLDSLLRQTFQNWHAICVNDGSTDNSLEILQEYAMRDMRFEIINKKNGGSSEARNTGMKYARGEYILFVDSDDFIHDQTLELMVGTIKQKRADMALFNFDVPFYKDLKSRLKKNKDISDLVPTSRRRIYKVNKFYKFVTKNILMHCTERNRSFWLRRPARVRKHCYPVLALYKKDLIKDIPFIKGIIIEDFPWWVSVLHKKPKTVITKLPLYFYIPNIASQLNSSKSLFMAKSIATGLRVS